MPNDEHVAMLARGAEVWNGWRADHDEMPDLSRAGVRGCDLSGFDLSSADLRACRSPGDEPERGKSVGCAPGARELLQGGARWRRSCWGLLERSPIPQLRSARCHPELAISLPR